MTNDFNNLLEEDLAGRSLSVGQIIDGTVVQISEDGVFVDIGAKREGHLELDQIFQEELAALQIGQKIKVRIQNRVDGEFKLSKKSVDFEEAWRKLIQLKNDSNEVDITVDEKVKNGYMASAFSVLQGFIHHTNFHGRPEIGHVYKAQVLDLNRKARKLVFTRRDIIKRERDEALERDYSVLQEGMVIEGIVDKLSPYGAFVKITDNLTGLLHISEFSFEHVKKPSEVLKAGDTVQVKILNIDREKNKISLSRKATLKDPLMLMLPGEELDGTVESLADFGVFVKLDGGITGLVHISELAFKQFEHPSELYKPRDSIRVKVLKVQVEDRKVSLSAKACERDPWSEVFSKFSIGQAVSGKIIQILQSGAVLKLDEFFDAFIPIGEISEEHIKEPGDVLSEGEEKSGVILSIDSAKRRIRVSLYKTAESIAKSEAAAGSKPIGTSRQSMSQSSVPGKVTLGDILGGKLDLTSISKKVDEELAPEVVVEEDAAPEVVSSEPPEDVLGVEEETADAPTAKTDNEPTETEDSSAVTEESGEDSKATEETEKDSTATNKAEKDTKVTKKVGKEGKATTKVKKEGKDSSAEDAGEKETGAKKE